ncbi:MAG: zinc ABC transporter substrate-binding protein [Carnobacterium alterfunditum]
MKSTKLITMGLTLIGAAAILASCGTDEQASKSSENTSKENKLKVVTTFYPIYDFTRNVTQDSAEVSLLLPAGTDVHSFEPSANEVGVELALLSPLAGVSQEDQEDGIDYIEVMKKIGLFKEKYSLDCNKYYSVRSSSLLAILYQIK